MCPDQIKMIEQLDMEIDEYMKNHPNNCYPGDSIHDPTVTKEQLDREIDEYMKNHPNNC